jgi:hypothetical protein
MDLTQTLLGLMAAVAIPAVAGAVVGITLRSIKDHVRH